MDTPTKVQRSRLVEAMDDLEQSVTSSTIMTVLMVLAGLEPDTLIHLLDDMQNEMRPILQQACSQSDKTYDGAVKNNARLALEALVAEMEDAARRHQLEADMMSFRQRKLGILVTNTRGGKVFLRVGIPELKDVRFEDAWINFSGKQDMQDFLREVIFLNDKGQREGEITRDDLKTLLDVEVSLSDNLLALALERL